MNSSRCPHRHNRRLFVALGLFLLPGIFLPWPADAGMPETGEALAIGEAPVLEGNYALARKTAIDQALMKGVESYLLRLLGSGRAVDHFDCIARDLLPAAQEQVTNFHILTEKPGADKYRVLIKVKVNEGMVRERLRSAGVILSESPGLDLLLMVSEVRDGTQSYWWKDPENFPGLSSVELALHKAFQDKGFRPVNHTFVPPGANQPVGVRAACLENDDLVTWGRLFSADWVLYGECRMVSDSHISLNIKAVYVPKTMTVCEETVTQSLDRNSDPGQSFSAPLEDVTRHLTDRISPCMVQAIAGESNTGASLTVTLKGMRMPKDFWRFSDFLTRDVAGATSVIPSEIRADTMSATVKFEGRRDAFIHRVLSHPKRPFPLRLYPGRGEAVVFSIE